MWVGGGGDKLLQRYMRVWIVCVCVGGGEVCVYGGGGVAGTDNR